VYGGGSDKLYSDLHSFDTNSYTWAELEFSGQLPPYRQYSCISIAYPYIFVFGGVTSEGLSSDLWLLNLEDFTSKELDLTGSGGPPDMSYANCKAYQADGDFVFEVFTGLGDGDAPITDTYEIRLKLLKWTLTGSSQALSGGCAAYKFGSKILVAGGEEWGLYSNSQVYLADLESDYYVELGSLPDSMFYMARAYHGSTLYLHGGSDTLFEKARLEVPSRLFYKVDLKSNCGDYCDWPCSPGTYQDVDTCQLCSAGHYSEVYSNSECDACPAGTATKTQGNTSRRQCYPCAYGFYSPDPGAKVCSQCKINYQCPIGSYTIVTEAESSAVETQQPAQYEESSKGVQTVTISVLSIGGFIGLCFVVVTCVVSARVRNSLRSVDIYSDRHNHMLKQPMVLKTTNLGGFFSVFFFLAAILYVIIALYIFFEYNIEETKGLVPLATLEEDYDRVSCRQFTADIEANLKLVNYGGACGGKNTTTCSSKIKFHSTKVQGTMGNLTCVKEGTSCVIAIECLDCEVLPGAELKYDLTEDFSYASGFVANITSTSSIPHETSASEQSIDSSQDRVMLGPNAWQVYFEMTPSVFISDSQQWSSEETGYHVSVVTSEDRGSEAEISE
jgi:hypothetical protein